MRYTFQFKLFGKKVQMLSEWEMGIVVEKEPDIACVRAKSNTENFQFIEQKRAHILLRKGAHNTKFSPTRKWYPSIPNSKFQIPVFYQLLTKSDKRCIIFLYLLMKRTAL